MTSLSLKKPTRERARVDEGEKRLVAEIPAHLHKQVRVRCLERGILVRDYLIALLDKDGIR